MNLTQLLFDALAQQSDKVLVAFLLIVTTVAWLWSIVAIAREKTADPLDRIVWLMIVLILSVIGTVLYVLFSGTKKANPHDESELKRRANEGTLR